MLLQEPVRVEKRCPRVWSWATGLGLVAIAVLIAGLGLRADAASPDKDVSKKEEVKKDEPKKAEPIPEQPKKEEPKLVAPFKAAPDFPGLQFDAVPPGADPEQARQMRRMMEQQLAQMRKMMKQNGVQFGGGGFNPFGANEQGRLGVMVEKPSETLVEQLDLPKGQGLAIEEVHAGSAAAKAGIKAHDILLEFGGKSVPDDTQEFVKILEAVKPNTPVDAVVLRKGKKETIKGVSLPEVKEAELPAFPGVRLAPQPVPGIAIDGGFAAPRIHFAEGAIGGGNGVMTTTFRNDDRFTTRHQEGTLVITVTGKVADGKAKVNEIQVQDGTESHKYESVEKVPERYRDKVKNLSEMSEKGSIKIEIKK